MHGENHDFDLWKLLKDSARRAHAVEHGHRKVHQNDVGLCLASKGDCFLAIACLAHNFLAGVFESPTNSVSKDLMVIG
ncbi:unannotated protein [freshwater metagenome]|uniref:Unannotated protein n=1 Tax=freshwater metagenome TaxID=449393 RepID=A0A6J6U6Q6_9ZZZZ